MKKVSLLLLVIFCSVVLAGCSGQNREPKDLLNRIKFRNKIVIGVKSDSKPFGFIEKDELQGFDIDVAKAITRRILGDEKYAEFVYVTPESRISELNSKNVDIIIAAMSINPARADIVDFTKPYFIAGQALLVQNGSKVNSIESLNNNGKVGIILGTTSEKTARMLAPNATVIGKRTYGEAFELLKDGKIDAVLADDSMLYGFIMDNKGYKILPARYTREYYAIALRQGKENKELKAELNKIIEYLQGSGKLNRIKEKWIPNLHMAD